MLAIGANDYFVAVSHLTADYKLYGSFESIEAVQPAVIGLWAFPSRLRGVPFNNEPPPQLEQLRAPEMRRSALRLRSVAPTSPLEPPFPRGPPLAM